jgi:hypothetical protein
MGARENRLAFCLISIDRIRFKFRYSLVEASRKDYGIGFLMWKTGNVKNMTDFVPVFGSFIRDFVGILILGAAGGIIFALLMEKGLTFPFKVYNDEKLTMLNFGFLADLIIGGVAAALVYALNPPVSPLIFVVIGVTSGVGGKAILTGYMKSKESDEEKQKKVFLAERYRAAVARHAGPVMSQGNMQLLTIELMEIDDQLLN